MPIQAKGTRLTAKERRCDQYSVFSLFAPQPDKHFSTAKEKGALRIIHRNPFLPLYPREQSEDRYFFSGAGAAGASSPFFSSFFAFFAFFAFLVTFFFSTFFSGFAFSSALAFSLAFSPSSDFAAGAACAKQRPVTERTKRIDTMMATNFFIWFHLLSIKVLERSIQEACQIWIKKNGNNFA
ncbi:MAG: hypothetical protein ACE14T_02430 [Syntrophales bacterium]